MIILCLLVPSVNYSWLLQQLDLTDYRDQHTRVRASRDSGIQGPILSPSSTITNTEGMGKLAKLSVPQFLNLLKIRSEVEPVGKDYNGD